MTRLIIRNARLLDPASGLDRPGDLVIEDGRIADWGQIGAAEGETLEAGGACLAPGLVDLRVRTGEPGAEHTETIASASAAAAAGGVTAIACLPDTEPPIEDPSLVQFLARAAAATGLVRVFPYGAVTRGRNGRELTEMGLMTAAGVVGFSDGSRPIADAGVMRRALSYARGFGQVVLNHPVEPTLAGVATEGELATRLGLPATPAIAEAMMVERDLMLVALTGGRYHAGPVSTAAAVAAIRRAKADGLTVTADTAPAYFALNETAISDYSTAAKVSPPLRTEADRRAVLAGLADGTLDAIASDHAPLDADAKRLPFAQAAAGISGLETLLPLALEQVHNGSLPLLTCLQRLTAGPAAVLGRGGGRLQRGAPADLVLFTLDTAWRIDAGQFRSMSRNTPFHRRPVQGRVVATLLDGRVVHRA